MYRLYGNVPESILDLNVSQYSKKKLNDFYKTAGNVKSVYDVLPESLKAIVDAF
jgi:hypothetical protein